MPRMPAARGYQPGFSVVAPAPTPRVVRGPSAGEAIARIGQTVGEVADTIGQRQLQQQQRDVTEAKGREREAEQLLRQEQKEAQQEQKRINRLQAATAQTELRITAAALQEDLDGQLETGALQPDQYQSKLAEGLTKRASELREGLDPSAVVDFDLASVEPFRMAQVGAHKSLRAHRKRVAVAGLDKGRDALVRLAVTDLPRALASGAAMYAQDGPYAAQIGIDEAQKQGSSFREAATRAHFQQRVANAQNDPRMLGDLRKAIAANTDLEPTQQTALLGSIDGRSAVLENRARTAAEAQSRKQDQAFKALQELDSQGLPLSPDFVAKTMGTLKGSPLESAAVALVNGSAATAAFGSRSLPEQNRIVEAEIQAARAAGVTPESSKRLSRLIAMRNAAEAAYRADPWKAGTERGAIDPVPALDTSSLAAVAQTLQARMAVAPQLDAAAGWTVTPLRPSEAEGLADTLNALPVPERTKMLGAIHEQIGPERMRAVAEQMKAKSGTLGIAAAYQAAGMKTEAGLNLGELVLRGADARKNKTVKIDEAAETGVEAQIRKALEGAYATPQATDAAVEASLNVYAGMAADGRRVTAAEALRAATGGVTEHNGQKIPMPYGWDARRVKNAIAAVTPAWIEREAGSDAPLWIGTQQILPEDVARMVPRAQLRSAGPGKYAVRIGDQFVRTPDGKPLAITLPDEVAVEQSRSRDARTGELGRLTRPGGGYSTEISITVTDPDLNGGKPTNVPTLVRGQKNVDALLRGEDPTEEQQRIAIERAKARQRDGQQLPAFDTLQDAERAAKARSDGK